MGNFEDVRIFFFNFAKLNISEWMDMKKFLLFFFPFPDYRNHDRIRWYRPTNVDGKNSRLVFQRIRYILFRTSSRKLYRNLKNFIFIYLLSIGGEWKNFVILNMNNIEFHLDEMYKYLMRNIYCIYSLLYIHLNICNK